jgi:hypothetical protein
MTFKQWLRYRYITGDSITRKEIKNRREQDIFFSKNVDWVSPGNYSANLIRHNLRIKIITRI